MVHRTDIARETPDEIAAYFERLWPLLRSITGKGARRTHDILGEIVSLERFEIPSGTKVLDWTVPKEWVVREAYVAMPDGRRILDVNTNNLHLLNYSIPFRGRVSRAELDGHLYSMPHMAKAIPYVTSYYRPRWGFCLSQETRDALPDGEYDVVIDTDHINGSMTLSEAVLPGAGEGEVLISTYTCHPSLANNELSGPLVAAFLYRRLASVLSRRLTYRFVFAPETIGAIVYLAMRGDHLRRHLVAGYVATCVGTDAPFTYKKSRRGDTLADRAALLALDRVEGPQPKVRDFFPSGSDERQYCSPGFDLPVGSIMRSSYEDYSEYHTSLDNRDLISFDEMVKTVDLYFDTCMALDLNATYRALVVEGEPQYSERGLARDIDELKCLQWLVNFSDGGRDLIEISMRSGIDIGYLSAVARRSCEADLLERLR